MWQGQKAALCLLCEVCVSVSLKLSCLTDGTCIVSPQFSHMQQPRSIFNQTGSEQALCQGPFLQVHMAINRLEALKLGYCFTSKKFVIRFF